MPYHGHVRELPALQNTYHTRCLAMSMSRVSVSHGDVSVSVSHGNVSVTHGDVSVSVTYGDAHVLCQCDVARQCSHVDQQCADDGPCMPWAALSLLFRSQTAKTCSI